MANITVQIPLPSFSPGDATAYHQWEAKFKAWCDYQARLQQDPAVLVAPVVNYAASLVHVINGEAFQVWNTLPAADKLDSMKALKALETNFERDSPAFILRQQFGSLRRTPEETLRAWEDRVAETAAKVYGAQYAVHELDVVHRFIGGIADPELGRKLLEAEPNTSEKLDN